MGDDDELGAVGEAADQLQEAVDVGVVERGLDLVEDVEGARPGEEDGEDEGERDQRLLAAGEQRELAGRLAGRGDLDLDAELLAFFVLALVAFALLLRLGLLGVAHRVQADPPQAATPSREEVLDHLLEVLRRRLEGLLEGALDLRVDLADQRLQFAHAALGVLALGLQRLDVLAGLLVLLLGERVDRPDLGAATLQPLQAAIDVGPLLVAQSLLGGLDLLAQPLGDRGHLLGGLGAAVAEVRGLDLRLGECVRGGFHLHLQLGLLARALAHLLGDRVAVALLADDLRFDPLNPGADRGFRRAGRGRGGANVVEQLLAGGDAFAQGLAVALAEQALGTAGVPGRHARRRPGRRPAPPPASASAASLERACSKPAIAPVRPASISASSSSSLRARSAGAPSAEPRSRVSGPNSARSPSRAPVSSVSRSPSPAARTATRCCSPRSLVNSPHAWVRSRSRAAKRSSAARRRPLTSARRFSTSRSLGPRLLGGTLGRFRPVLAEAQFLGDQTAAQLQLLALDPGAELGRLGLSLQRPQPRPRLALEVEGAVEVVARGTQLQLGAAAALAVLAEARRLLDQQPSLARFGVDDRLDPALADHRVHLAAEVGVGEDLDDVDETAAGAVEPVDARRRSGRASAGSRSRRARSRPVLRSCRSRPRPRRRGAGRRPRRPPRSRPASRRRGSRPGSARRAPRARRR